MKMKHMFLASFLFVVSCCLSAAEDGATFKNLLGLTNVAGSTNIYSLTLPASLVISNVSFSVSRRVEVAGGYLFELSASDARPAATCGLFRLKSSSKALDDLCGRLVSRTSMDVARFSRQFRATADADGNVVLERVLPNGSLSVDGSKLWRTFGNLYVNVNVNTNNTVFSAQIFGQAILSGQVPQ